MRQKAGPQKPAAEQVIKDIRRATRKHHSAEDKIRVVLEGLPTNTEVEHLRVLHHPKGQTATLAQTRIILGQFATLNFIVPMR